MSDKRLAADHAGAATYSVALFLDADGSAMGKKRRINREKGETRQGGGGGARGGF